MTPDPPGKETESHRWRRMWEVFDHARLLRGTARAAALDELCDGDAALRLEVESLLAAHDRDEPLLDEPLVDLRAAPALEESRSRPQIERYLLLESLGSGGMGRVFAARRADGLHDEVVAVKVLKRGLDTDALVRRFHTERRILARLAHPHIARLLDGGSTTDGRPYLVMERVEGTPIDRFCDERRLPIRRRLELFQRVCEAVHFAHRNLVIHRDLKPGNILITDTGEPKLLDFGIAKLLDPRPGEDGEAALTEPGGTPMTPQYASPEQISGEPATTASDVYALGVLLYQLLTGRLPSASGAGDRPLEEIEGDLDNIVLMALAQEPEERYGSAAALAEDLERFERGLPVRARADTLGYRARKFVRRHRLAVASGAVVFAALIILVGLLLAQRQKILEERDRALEERHRATTVSDFLVELFASPDPTRIEGETVTARQLLDRGIDQIETGLASEPRLQGSLMLTMGRSLSGLGHYEEASAVLRRSLELRRGDGQSGEEVEAEASFRLAEALFLGGHYDAAESLLRRALEIRRRVLDPHDPRIAEVHFQLGSLLAKQGEYEAAGVELTAAETLTRAAGEEEMLARILDRHATLLQDLGHLDRAQALFDQSLALSRQVYGEAHVRVALALNNSAGLAMERGDGDRAEALYREAETLQRRSFDGDHPHLATTLANQGLLYSKRGDLERAESLLSQALSMYRNTLGTVHPKIAVTLSNLAAIEAQRGDWLAAENHYLEALALQDRTLGSDHAETANTLNNLAQLFSLQERFGESEQMFRRAVEAFRRQLGPEHPRVGAGLCNLAEVAQQRGDLESSAALYREAIGILRRGLGDDHPNLAAALTNLATLEQAKGDVESAVTTSAEAVEVMRRALGDAHPDVAKTLTRLASLQLELGQPAAAEAAALEALEIFRERLPTAEDWIAAAEKILRASRDAGE